MLHQGAEVLGTVAQERHALLGERGEDEFALCAAGQLFQRLGVDYFGVEVVFVDMRAVLLRAFGTITN